MTPPERLVAGLDIGSAKTTAIIAEVVGDLPKHPTIKVLGVGQARTTGMRRGVVADIEETTRSIRAVGADQIVLQISELSVRAMTNVTLARLGDIDPVQRDLARRQLHAAEIDLRYRDQVIARLP